MQLLTRWIDEIYSLDGLLSPMIHCAASTQLIQTERIAMRWHGYRLQRLPAIAINCIWVKCWSWSVYMRKWMQLFQFAHNSNGQHSRVSSECRGHTNVSPATRFHTIQLNCTFFPASMNIFVKSLRWFHTNQISLMWNQMSSFEMSDGYFRGWEHSSSSPPSHCLWLGLPRLSGQISKPNEARIPRRSQMCDCNCAGFECGCLNAQRNTTRKRCHAEMALPIRNTYNDCINYTARRKTLRQPNSISAQCRDNGKWWGKATKFTFHDRDTGSRPGARRSHEREDKKCVRLKLN